METKPRKSEAMRLPPVGNIVARLVIFAFLWWALTEGETYNLWFGVIVVIAATVVSIALQPATGFRPLYLGPVYVFFVRESIRGGIDVARRAFSPNMPIDPGFTEVTLRLPEGPARVFLTNLLNITPGTVSVELLPGSLRIHMLHTGTAIEEKVREMEDLMANLFDLDLPEIP